MHTLVVVDIQNDFCPGGALEVPNAADIVPLVNSLTPQFDLIVATQDWHPPNHMSFASNHEGEAPFNVIEYRGMEQVMWPDHCVQGSEGAEFHPDLDHRPFEAIFRKGMNPKIDSYSGFYDNGHEKSTGLAGYLREHGAKRLHFVGLAADICVNFTMQDALKEGFEAVLIEDGTRALSQDDFEAAKERIAELGGEFTTSKAFMA